MLGSAGCTGVAREVYDRDVRALRQQTEALAAHKAAQVAEARAWKGKHAALIEELTACRKNVSDLEDGIKTCEDKLNAVARNSLQCGDLFRQCEDEKRKLREQLLAERDKAGKLAGRLEQIQGELDRLRRTIDEVRARLRALVEAGKLRVEVKNGFLVIGLESDILFDTGKSELKAEAKPVLLELGKVLAQFKDRRFQVAGHTDPRGGDDVNWQLSVHRALSVVEFLIKTGGVPARMLSAGGYAHYLPASERGDAEGMRMSRRVEFLLLPDLTELYNLSAKEK